MNEQEYWNRFKRTGHVADYLQYKNAVAHKSGQAVSQPDKQAEAQTDVGGAHVNQNRDRRPDYT